MARKRARPSKTQIDAQFEAKARWHREQAALPFEEKIRRVLDMQKKLFPILKARREMRPWERPWEIEG
jgi:hypothetical protein